jgi:DNA invertase Pin-like site-specific DNA recombinase
MAVVGYGRVSSVGQSLEIQQERLTLYGCEKLFTEKKSGTTTNNRKSLKECLTYLREGDKLVITKLDRLCRSIKDLSNISDQLNKKGVSLVVLDQAIDTSTSTGRLLFNMLGCISEFEAELRKERVRDGVKKSMENGVKFGRKSKLSAEQITKMKSRRDSGVKISDLVAEFGISRESVYRLTRTI